MRNMSWLHLGLQPDVLHLCCFHWGLGTTHCMQRPNVTANRWTTQCPFSHCRALGLINSVITFTNNQTLFLAYSQIKSRFRAKNIYNLKKKTTFPQSFLDFPAFVMCLHYGEIFCRHACHCCCYSVWSLYRVTVSVWSALRVKSELFWACCRSSPKTALNSCGCRPSCLLSRKRERVLHPQKAVRSFSSHPSSFPLI